MNLETVYKELRTILAGGDVDFMKLLALNEKIEKQVRKETCYKTTNKTRINAITKVASKDESRPALTGYGVYGDYKVVTDSYHLIAIYQDEMPLPLVAGNMSHEEVKEYQEKHGRNSVINGMYPNMEHIINFDKELWNKEVTPNYDDIESFYKLHKNLFEKTKKTEDLYQIGDKYYNIRFIKNVIDVLGTNCKAYYREDSYNTPLYFINDKNELGLVLPIRNF